MLLALSLLIIETHINVESALNHQRILEGFHIRNRSSPPGLFPAIRQPDNSYLHAKVLDQEL